MKTKKFLKTFKHKLGVGAQFFFFLIRFFIWLLATIWGGGGDVLMGEGSKFRFGVLWGEGEKNQIFDLGKDVLLEEVRKKKFLNFEQDVLWWEGGIIGF
jgi:hypothetical protein